MKNRRKEKRAFRKMGMDDPVYFAYTEGQSLAYGDWVKPRWRRNPYPPGRRYDAFEQGFNLADPMGDWHGRNE
jgi:hypothetical protein